MHDNWATGTADATYRIQLAGGNAESLRNSAFGSGVLTWNNGSLRHVSLESGGAPLAFSVFTGAISLQNGKLILEDGKLHATNGLYTVSGTASSDRILEVHLERDGGGAYVISGSLENPRVEAAATPATQAALR